MPAAQQYELVKQQLKSFEPLGYMIKLDIAPQARGAHPIISIINRTWIPENDKQYHFSDPDWNVVSRQLATLYRNLKYR